MTNALLYPSPDYISIDVKGSKIYGISALDIVDLRGMDENEIIKKKIVPFAIKATFFDVIWLAFASEKWQFVAEEIQDMIIPNAGIVVIEPSLKEFNVLFGPKVARCRTGQTNCGTYPISLVRLKNLKYQ